MLTIVFVKPDFMMMDSTMNVNHVVISVTNVLIPLTTVPSVLLQELMNQNVHAQMECMMMEQAPVLIVHTNVQNVQELPITVIHALETESEMTVYAQPIITTMELMLYAHNVQTDVHSVILVMFALVVNLTESSSMELVNVLMDIMKYVVPKELIVMLTAHNQNVSHVTILVTHVLEVQQLVLIVMIPEN